MSFMGSFSGVLHPFTFLRSTFSTQNNAKRIGQQPSRAPSPRPDSHVTTAILQTKPASSPSSTSPPPSWPSEAALHGAFGNTEPKQQQDLQVDVTGKLPEWLSGNYLRNGPGTYENGTSTGMLHMFDGYAMILKLEIEGKSNSVKLSHKFVNSEAFKAFDRSGEMHWREFATPRPTHGLLEKAKDVATMALGSMGIGQGVTDNASVNVLPQGDRVWAVTETVAGTFEIDPSTLSTTGRVQYNDSLKGDLTTAHPTVLPNGDVINLLSAPVVGFTVYRQKATSSTNGPSRERIATIKHRHPISPAWIHDFPGSNRFIVIPETPLYFNLGALMLGHSTEHIFLDWAPEEGSRLHVVDVQSGEVKSYTTPAFFAFHWANAHESSDGRYLHIDGAVYDDPEIVNHLTMTNVRNFKGPEAGPSLPKATLRRLTIDLQAPDGSPVGHAWESLIDDEASYGNFVEFPCVNPSKKGGNARYVWGTGAVRPTNVNNALVKFDLVERKCVTWHEGGGIVGEPLFIPAPMNEASNGSNGSVNQEDEGVVIAVVAQPNGKAALLVLDGQSHKEVARAELPYGITNGFHGAFIPLKK